MWPKDCQEPLCGRVKDMSCVEDQAIKLMSCDQCEQVNTMR